MELPLLSSDIHISKKTRGSTVERLTISKIQAQMREVPIINLTLSSYFCIIIELVGAHWNCLTEAIPTCSQNLCFDAKITKMSEQVFF